MRIDGSSAARAWLLCAAPFTAPVLAPLWAPLGATLVMPFVGATAHSQTDLGARLDEHLQRLVPWGLSGSVLVARNGRVVLAAGYGMADRGRGVSNTAQTQFPLGALGQQFTAIAVLQLVEQGRLALDDTLGARLDGVPEDKRAITLRQLLDHQSGLPENVGDPLAAPESREDALARILGAPLVFAPGSRAQESAAGYALLAAVVEKAAGIPFEQHLRASVLDRAGLSACLFAGDTRLERAPLARAMAEEREADSPARWPASWPLYGTGALFASVGDLYRFERALAPEVLLQPQSLEFFLDPPTGEWSGGMRVVRLENGRRVAERSARLGGFQLELRRGLDDALTWALLLNEELPAAATHVDLLLSGRALALPPEVGPLDVKLAAAASGTYELPGGGRLRIAFERGRLSILAENQAGIDVLARPADEDKAWEVEYGNRALALCESLRGRDFPAAAGLLGRTAQEVDGWLGTWWRRLEERFGEAGAPRLVACLPREQVVVVRIELARGAEVAWFRWNGRALVACSPGPAAFAECRLWPAKEGGFVAYDPRTFVVRQLTLMQRADGSVRGLAFPKDGGEASELGARRLD